MKTLSIDFSDLDSDALDELEDAAESLAGPEGRDSRWGRSFEALDGLRSLVNALACHGVVTWTGGEWAGLSASFDSDGECTEPDGITIALVLPKTPLTGRFGVFVAVFISDIDDVFQGRDLTARERAEVLAGVLNDAVTDARAAA